VDAIVGLDVLSRNSFTIDYEHRQIDFGPVAEDKLAIPLEVTPPFLTVQLAIAGTPFRLLIDTGGSRLVLFNERAHGKLPTLAIRGEQVLYHLSGTTTLHRVILPSLDTGTATPGRVEAFLSDAPVDGYPRGIDGVLGVRVLASKQARFDFERRRFSFR
jgi:hypothetical protein